MRDVTRSFSFNGPCRRIVQRQYNEQRQEIIKVREVIPHTGPIPIVIPLKLFLDDINFPADNVTARVTWKFVEEGKCSKFCTMPLSVFKLSFMA